MSILVNKVSSDVMDVQVLEAELVLRLSDGRTVSAPPGLVSSAFARNSGAT